MWHDTDILSPEKNMTLSLLSPESDKTLILSPEYDMTMSLLS